jgi:hypothetical protein
MTLEAKSKKPLEKYVPYSDWSSKIIENIKGLVDECLDRYKEDKETSTEILTMLSKLQALVEKKYKSK